MLELIAQYYPQSSRAQRQLGDVYRAADRADDARAAYERALMLDPFNSEARNGLDRLDE
ncbi:tetratricopeptide repeat protein [Hyphobacterium sp.]|uniref:tetratricopeptide repeat protein n=1 Tax=Hyphobacterium sp. TaxID=2004662 RepID=UPI003B51E637